MNAPLWLLAGFAGGTAHFALLRWNTSLYAALANRYGRPWAGHPRLFDMLPMLRFVTTASLLFVAAQHGALPLLLVGLGIMLARPMALRVLA